MTDVGPRRIGPRNIAPLREMLKLYDAQRSPFLRNEHLRDHEQVVAGLRSAVTVLERQRDYLDQRRKELRNYRPSEADLAAGAAREAAEREERRLYRAAWDARIGTASLSVGKQ